MKYTVVWSLQRGVINPPEELSEEDVYLLRQQDFARKQVAKEENRWRERCDYKIDRVTGTEGS